MAQTVRFSVAKTMKSYSPEGVMAIEGSTVFSTTQQWGTDPTSTVPAYPPSRDTPRVPPTS